MLLWATGLLTLLESITKVPDWQIVYLLTSFFLRHDSMITAEAITNTNKQHKSLGIALLIVIVELELFFSDSQPLQC